MSSDARRANLNFAFLAVGQASAFATVFLSVFFGPFAVREVTGGFTLGGLPVAMYPLASLLVVVPAGRWMDRVGRAPVLALGHALGAVGAASVAAVLLLRMDSAVAIPAFLGSLFLLSAGSSVALLARVAVSDLYPPDTRARGLGRFVLLSFAGSAAGAAIFLALSATGAAPVASGYLAMLPFFGAGALGMVAARASLPRPAMTSAGSFGRRDVLRRPGVPWTIVSNAGANAGMAGVMSLASPALVSLSGAAMGGVMLSHFAGMFLPSPVAGRISDRRGRALSIAAGGVVLALGAVLFTRTDLAPVAGAGLFLVGAGWCMTFVPGTALLADSTSFEERGALFGVNDALVAVVGGISVVLAGVAFSTAGVAGLAVLGASCAAVSVLAGVRLRRLREDIGPAPPAALADDP